MNGVEAISTDQLKQRMLEGQGGREMQTSSCCIASPIASCTVSGSRVLVFLSFFICFYVLHLDSVSVSGPLLLG